MDIFYQKKKFVLLKFFFAFFIILSFTKTEAQSNFKCEKHQFYNIGSGISVIPGTYKLNNRLISNNFPHLIKPNYTFDFSYGSVSKKGIVEMQSDGTGGFVGKGLSYSLLSTENISFRYGRDILPKAEYTYFYPFLGYSMHIYTLEGKSPAKERINSNKYDFDIVSGLGFRQFFKKDFIGFFNNLALNAGISIPTITGKWRDTGSQYLYGMYKLQSAFDFTASIGF